MFKRTFLAILVLFTAILLSTESFVIEAYETDQSQNSISLIDFKKDEEKNLETERVEIIQYTILIMGKIKIVEKLNSFTLLDKTISSLIGIALSSLFAKTK